MLQSVIETPDFLRDAENSRLTAEERGRIVSLTAAFPKSRSGHSGNWRRPEIRFAKGDKIDLTGAERNELRKELAGLAEDCRNGVRRHVQGW